MGWGVTGPGGRSTYTPSGGSGPAPTGSGFSVPKPPSISYSPTIGGYNLGGGNPNSYGASDGAQYDRPYQAEGKVGINLLDYGSQYRLRQQAAAAGVIDEGTPGDIFSGPGGFFSGIGGAIGGTLGPEGAQVGSNIGKLLELPLGLIGGLPIPVPFVDDINKELEKTTPHLVSDIARVPTNVGAGFMSMLGVLGLMGRAVERTYAGWDNRNMVFQPDIQAKVDSGEWSQDTAIDEMVLRGAGYTDDWVHNMGLSMLLDPINLLSLGTASAASAAGAAGKLAKAGVIARTLDVGAAKAAIAAGDSTALQLSRLARMNLAVWSSVPGFESTVVPIANQVTRITDPLRIFGGGNIGKRSLEHLSVAASTGVVSAYKVNVVHDLGTTLERLIPGSQAKFDKLMATATANYMEQFVADEMAADALKRGAIPFVDGENGMHLTPTMVARSTLRNGALDTNIGKHIEVMVESLKPTLAHLSKDEVVAQTRLKLQRTFGLSAEEAARIAVDDDTAMLVHGLYYFNKGLELNDVVKPKLRRMAKSGKLPDDIKPERLTMVAERTLTKQRAVEVDKALKSGDLREVRRVTDKYADFDWLDSHLDGGEGQLIPTVRAWLEANRAGLLDEVPVRDANGALRRDIPMELRNWAEDSESFGYRLANSPPVDEAPAILWRTTYDENGKLINVNPWMDFSTEQANMVNPGRLGRLKLQMFRQVRAERIMWTNKRRFVTHVARTFDVAPKTAERIYKNIMWTANERGITVRGLKPEEMYGAALKVLRDEGLRPTMTDRQVVDAILVAFRGDLSQVGVTQGLTGLAKQYLPGAGGNYWGGLAERIYPMVRFTYNPWFAAQEFVEPYILNRARGVTVPIRMDSKGASEALALRNAVNQLVRTSQNQDGSIMEMAEYQRMLVALSSESRTYLGGSSFFGKMSGALPWGRIAERKLMAEATLTKDLYGRRLREAFIAMRGQEFWDDMERHFGTTDPGDIAMRWTAENFHFVNADGVRVGNIVDLVKPHSFGKTASIARGEGKGLRWHHLSEVMGRGQKVDDGERLFQDLKSGALTHADFLDEAQKAGVDKDFAHKAWQVATGPEVDDFWKGYRETFLHKVQGATPTETRKLRDNELKQVRALVQMRALSLGISEDEFIATRYADIPRRATATTAKGNHVLYDMVEGWREMYMPPAIRRYEELVPFTDPEPVHTVPGYKARTAARLADPMGEFDIPVANWTPEYEQSAAAFLDSTPKQKGGGIGYRKTIESEELHLVHYSDDGVPIGFLRMSNSMWPTIDTARVMPESVVSTDLMFPEYVEVYVRPEYRRTGVATRLYDEARGRGWDLRRAIGINGAPEGAGQALVRSQKRIQMGAPVPGYRLDIHESRFVDKAKPTGHGAGYTGRRWTVTVYDDLDDRAGTFDLQEYDAGTGDIQIRSHGSFLEPAHHRQGIAPWVYSTMEKRTGLKMFPDQVQLVPGKTLWDRRRGLVFGTPKGVRRQLLPELDREKAGARLFDEMVVRDPDALRIEAGIPVDQYLPPRAGEKPLDEGMVRAYVYPSEMLGTQRIGSSTDIPLTVGQILREGVRDRRAIRVYSSPLAGRDWVEVHFRPQEIGLDSHTPEQLQRWMASPGEQAHYFVMREEPTVSRAYQEVVIPPTRVVSYGEPWMDEYRYIAEQSWGSDEAALADRITLEKQAGGADGYASGKQHYLALVKRLKQVRLERARAEGTLKLTRDQRMVEDAIASYEAAKPGKAMGHQRLEFHDEMGRLEVYGEATPEDLRDMALDWMTEPEGLRAKRWYADTRQRFIDIFGEMNGPTVLAFALSQASDSPINGLENVLRGLEAIANQGVAIQTRALPRGVRQVVGMARRAGIEKSLKLNEENIIRGILHLDSKGAIKIESGMAAKLNDFLDSLSGNETRRWTGRRGVYGPVAVDRWTARDVGFLDAVTMKRMVEAGHARSVGGGKTFMVGDGAFFFTWEGKSLAKAENFWLTDRAGKYIDFDGNPVSKPVNLLDNAGGLPKGLSYEHGVKVINEAANSFNTYVDPVTRKLGVWGKTDWTPAEVQAVGWMRVQKTMGGAAESPTEMFNRNAKILAVESDPGRASPRDLRWARVVRKMRRQEHAYAARDIAEQMGGELQQGIMDLLGVPTVRGTGVARGGWASPDGSYRAYQAPTMWAVTPETADDIADIASFLSEQQEVWSVHPVAVSNFNPETTRTMVEVRMPTAFGGERDLENLASRLGEDMGVGYTIYTNPDGEWVLRMVDDSGTTFPKMPDGLADTDGIGRMLEPRLKDVGIDEHAMVDVQHVETYKAGPPRTTDAKGRDIPDWEAHLEDTANRLRSRGRDVDPARLARLRASMDEKFDSLIAEHFPDDYARYAGDTAVSSRTLNADVSRLADDFAGDNDVVAALRRLDPDSGDTSGFDDLFLEEDPLDTPPPELTFGRWSRFGDFEPLDNAIGLWDDNAAQLAPYIATETGLAPHLDMANLRFALQDLHDGVGSFDANMRTVRQFARSPELADEIEYMAKGGRYDISEMVPGEGQMVLPGVAPGTRPANDLIGRVTGRLHDRRGGNILGYTEPVADGRAIIRGMQNADPLTGLHELTHVFAQDLDPSMKARIIKAREDVITAARTDKSARIAELEQKVRDAQTKRTKQKYGALLAAARHDLGTIVDEAQWGVEHEEFFVDQFWRWFHAGEPASDELAGAFTHFKNWVKSAWDTLKRTTDPASGPVVHPEMEKVFNEMFSKPPLPSVHYDMDQYSLLMAAKQQLQESQEEAFTTQFFKMGRSFVERSLNHPFLGLYPLSYMWGKILPEMFRFLALRPFGMVAPMLGWNAFREVSDSVRAQTELDPAFRDFLDAQSDGIYALNSIFPALPNEIPTNAALPLRRIAEQGLTNEEARLTGEQPKPIDYMKGAQDSVEYIFGPATTLKNLSIGAKSVGDIVRSTFGITDETSSTEAAPNFEFNPNP